MGDLEQSDTLTVRAVLRIKKQFMELIRVSLFSSREDLDVVDSLVEQRGGGLGEVLPLSPTDTAGAAQAGESQAGNHPREPRCVVCAPHPAAHPTHTASPHIPGPRNGP